MEHNLTWVEDGAGEVQTVPVQMCVLYVKGSAWASFAHPKHAQDFIRRYGIFGAEVRNETATDVHARLIENQASLKQRGA